ncbi:synaptogenesis protein syg-2-like isoform X3 [Ruditapes philippinarum]|uniref:synaptogenesis protein syg-2-like isoform X3 n=1 Tax=Ruditapes philippinarum TaxID=129788 RepID=UPI00295B940F|nr:synaptogenesis protein syg-2-like isoform X3 [Ruditapes philippinarum]
MELRGEIIGRLLVFGIIFILRASGLQEFIERPQDLSVVKGQTAVLKCAVTNRVGMIQWGKGEINPIMLGFDRQIPGYNGRYSIIGNDQKEFNLQILNTNLDDDDVFQCQVGPADNNPGLRASAKLTVLVPPNFPDIVDYSNGSVVEVAYTEPVKKLVCISTAGRPAATIKWFRNSQEVTENVEYVTTKIANDKREDARSILTLNPTYPDDNNVQYTCQAHNNALINGPYRVTVILSVLYPPSPPKITGYKTDQVIRVNDTVQLMCTSEGGNPLAQIAWFRNNAQVDFSYSQRDNKAENELIITAERSDNDAEYRCEAWNSVNFEQPLMVTRKLVVYFAPKTATITGTREAKAGETLTLTCTTSNSNPEAIIEWIPRKETGANIRSRTEVSPNGGYITISEIDITLSNTQTSAIYTCSAENRQLGITVADTATVGVLYPPEAPVITGYIEGESIRAGDLVKLRCTAMRGNPPATLKWFKGDQEVTEVNDLSAGNIPNLEVAIVTKADDNGAIYRCEASNKATDSPLVALRKLTVHFPPAKVNISSDPVVARAGHRLRLTCTSASSNPAAEITWMHDNHKLTGTNIGMTSGVNGGKISKNQLEIIPTSADHNSAYGCRATNLVLQETIHDAITLNVLFKPEFRDKDDTVQITAGESRILNLTATANPVNGTYVLKRGETVIKAGDVISFSFEEGALTISAVSKEDSGTYTVTCTNVMGSTSFDFTLDVLYPAEIYESNPVTADAGTSVELKCLVRGNPMVPDMVTWKRDGFDMTRALPSYAEGVGTLIIENVEKTDSGTFTCLAHNGIGESTQQTIELTVKFVPVIDKAPKYSKAASEMGKVGKLECYAQGAPTVSFKWQKDGVDIVSDDVKYVIREKVTEEINYENILSIKNVVKSDYGIYQCIVTNEKGEDRLAVNFADTTKPDPPDSIEIVNFTHNSVTLKWNAGFSGGLVQHYRVRYKMAQGSQGYTQVDVQPKTSTVFTVRGLALGTEYEMSVMAYNDIGDSDYSVEVVVAKTSNLKPTSDVKKEEEKAEDMPVIIILVVCVVGIFLLALNIGLILFFVRRRKKRMENGSDTTSHTNTIELYGPNKETQLYPMTPSDESRSYGTYDKNDDDFSDDYKSYEQQQQQRQHKCVSMDDCLCLGKTTTWKDNCCFDPGDEDLKRVFLPPPEYGGVTYSHNKLDSPTFDHRHPLHTEPKHAYTPSDTDSCRKSPWTYEDPYTSKVYRGKGTFDTDYPDRGKDYSGPQYEPNGHAGGTRPKSITELSERSSRPSSRGVNKTPPPPPVRSSSKGAADIPPLPARNYESQDIPQPRYVPPPGSSTSFGNNINVINNPHYNGPSGRTPSPGQTDPTDDMRGYLV